MTENEAKSYMENEVECIKRASHCDRDCLNCKLVKEEEPLIESYDMAIQALSEIQQYRAIGTIGEFKALKEKSIAKKPKWHPNPCAEDNRIPICPNCNTIMVRTEIFGRTIDEHCVSCGQAIDWQ